MIETSPMSQEVVLLSWGDQGEPDRNAQKIAAFLGAKTSSVQLTEAALRCGESIRSLVPRCHCLIINAESLAKVVETSPEGEGSVRPLIELAQHVLIYGFEPTERHRAVLRTACSSGLIDVQPVCAADTKFCVSDDHRSLCRQFSGVSLDGVNPTRENVFIEGDDRKSDAIIRVGDNPFFVRASHGETTVFLLACRVLADLDELVGSGDRLPSWFSRLVPIMMFLRTALGESLWHNENPRACFIIDDPLLRDRYGFLEYSELTDRMAQRGFSTCIAFIPWNYRRSQKEVAALFSAGYGSPYLCIHGCDHTRAEFASTQTDSLRKKARLALDRMQTHQDISGAPFDDVMVFPQGLFSVEAITALKAMGYLAAVNSDVFPSTGPETLALRDLLDVSVTSFANFPLFGRHYPYNLADFAFDLFLGKPALAVEHHTYFRDGYDALESFVEQLNCLDERLEWTSLGTICSRACLTRIVGERTHVRFYTRRFQLKNVRAETRKYLLFKREIPSDGLPTVMFNGREWRCEQQEGDLVISIELTPGETADIRILSNGNTYTDSISKETELDNVQVLIRRHLCEFRDNYVHTNRVLNTMVSKVLSWRHRRKLQTA